MRTKEQYYELILQNRKLASDQEVMKCTCPNTLCDWHGKCQECVALHRYHNDHIPVCSQPVIDDKLRALVATAEMPAIQKKTECQLSIDIMLKKETKAPVNNPCLPLRSADL